MKHVLVLLSLVSILSVDNLYSQLVKGYGLKAGITSADQTFDWSGIPDPLTKRRVGFSFAAYVEWFSLPVFSVVTQVEYTPVYQSQKQCI